MKKYDLGLVRQSDMSKEMTLRNANERRRLDGHLKDLDNQLHNNLASMQSEIMELKNSPYGGKGIKTSPRFLENRERAYCEYGLRVSPSARNIRGETYTSPTPSLQGHAQEKTLATKSLVLPQINLEQTSLVSKSGKNTSTNASRIQNNFGGNTSRVVSPFGQRFLQIPTSPPLYRPSSLPDLRKVESRNRLSPRTARRALQSPEPWIEKQIPITLSSSPENNIENRVTKNRITNFIATSPENTQNYSEERQEFHRVVPEIFTENYSTDFEPKSKNLELKVGVFYNSMLAKAPFGEGESDTATPDLAQRMGFMNFDDVIDKRLKQSQQKPPTEEEMRKIRYLRWNEKEKETDIVKEIFKNRDSN